MEYFDDLASGQCADQLPVSGLPAIAVKNIHLTGVKAYCDEFPAARRTTSHVFNSELVSQLLTILLLKLFRLEPVASTSHVQFYIIMRAEGGVTAFEYK